MTVHFIGAGPGARRPASRCAARDLLARCPVCLYAGSLVPPELLAHCPPGARIVDTAPLTSTQIEAEFVAAHDAGPGRGAAAFRRPLDLQRAGRADAPAGAPRHPLHADARRAGLRRRRRGARARADRAGGGAERGADPHLRPRLAPCRAGETLAAFAATGATLAIHLAVHALDAIVDGADAALRRGLPGRGRGARELAGRAHAARHARHDRRRCVAAERRSSARRWCWSAAALAREDFRDSALYDPDYRRRFRGGAA